MDITAQELKSRLDNGEQLTIIDVREPYEYEEYNMGAQLIPLGTLVEALDDLENKKEDEIIVHCRSGVRSKGAQQIMQMHGFSKVINLTGGILAWKELN